MMAVGTHYSVIFLLSPYRITTVFYLSDGSIICSHIMFFCFIVKPSVDIIPKNKKMENSSLILKCSLLWELMVFLVK